MTKPILYSFRRCPYAMRGRLGILCSGISVELREIVLRDKAPLFLDTSPKGTVPVLVLPEGQVIEESLDVMIWALETADPKNMLPDDLSIRAEMMDLVSLLDGPFKKDLDTYKYPNKFEDRDPAEARERAAEFIWGLEARLKTNGNLFGPKKRFVDYAVLPFIRQFAHVDREWFYAQPWSLVNAWLAEFIESPEFKTIMPKFPKWVEGDQATAFP
jgi:glutathione S-transferase